MYSWEEITPLDVLCSSAHAVKGDCGIILISSTETQNFMLNIIMIWFDKIYNKDMKSAVRHSAEHPG